ncbi:MAG: hypothetical protein B6D64_13535 [Bacteroidetes bacterium 4484_276]|nr:MAG: hypothetical protein B6D64_13535 [Bacteroidetes bacterium 4484_276]
MKFKPGESGNPNGRPRGSKSKTTEQLRELFRGFLSANMETLQHDFDQLRPRDRLNFIERVAKLVLPPPVEPIERLTDEDFELLLTKIREEFVNESK